MLTDTQLRNVFSYNPITGKITWKVSPNQKIKVGDEAGNIHKVMKYRRIAFLGKQFLAHRLAWFLMTGEWPKKFIDHKNRIRHDNRWENLREATAQQNIINTGITKRNTTGALGVRRSGKKWRAQFDGVPKTHLGMFHTKEEAQIAYNNFMKKTFGEFYDERKAQTPA